MQDRFTIVKRKKQRKKEKSREQAKKVKAQKWIQKRKILWLPNNQQLKTLWSRKRDKPCNDKVKLKLIKFLC